MSESFGLYLVRNLIQTFVILGGHNPYMMFVYSDNGMVHVNFSTLHKLYAYVKIIDNSLMNRYQV